MSRTMVETEVTFADLPTSSQTSANSGMKPRRPPTVTPKRFTRFFTPRHSVTESRKSKRVSTASRQLRDITKNGVNRRAKSPRHDSAKAVQEGEALSTPRRSKRRKLSPAADSSPIQLLSSPCNRAAAEIKPLDILSDEDAATIIEGEIDTLCEGITRLPTPIRRLKDHDSRQRLLQRSFGGRTVLGRGNSHDPCVDVRQSTARFYSGPRDVYDFRSTTLPFCAASCHSNSLVALGDEHGNVMLVDSDESEDVDFSKPHISLKPHGNAIMDLAFSSDDFLLATASGDQSARIIDMRTQQVRYVMAGHVSSVKQVRFQPGNDSVLATSSRDGSVQIWDLRTRGTTVTETRPVVSIAGEEYVAPAATKTVYAETCIAIRDAHSNQNLPQIRRSSTDLFTSNNSSTRRNEISITAISFLPQGREHLLLSASEKNASIKVWDIRGKFSSRRGPAVPVSSTLEPPLHVRQRRYGLNSLVLSGDGARLYALCRDSTIYAYSTNHLILGHAPEFDAAKSAKWRPALNGEGKTGVGPLYGLRHHSMHISSFYVKAALRKAKGDREEMLAVGGRDGSIVCFPTDEAHLRAERGRRAREAAEISADEDPDADEEVDLPRTPTIRRSSAMLSTRRRNDDDDDDDSHGIFTRRRRTTHIYPRGGDMDAEGGSTPIYDHVGTPLRRGHAKEVTGVCWTADGDLVSVSDDWTARCWREGPQARQLRVGGEGGGARWNCGWAEDLGADFDEDDG